MRASPSNWEAVKEVKALIWRLDQAAQEVTRPVEEALGRSARAKARRPKAKAKHKAERKVDTEKRSKAAQEAVRRSLSWRPETGIAKGLLAGDALIPVAQAIYERRISKFEARGVWTALNVLDRWIAHRAEKSRAGTELEDQVLMTAFVEDQKSATGPLNTWN